MRYDQAIRKFLWLKYKLGILVLKIGTTRGMLIEILITVALLQSYQAQATFSKFISNKYSMYNDAIQKCCQHTFSFQTKMKFLFHIWIKLLSH